MNNDNRHDIEMLRSTYAHEKNKDRKHLLRLEIIKATDPQVKEQLELMLEEIEAEEARNKRIAIIISFVGMLALSLFFLYTLFYPNRHEASTIALESSSEAASVESSTEKATAVSETSTTDTSTEIEQSTENYSANYAYSQNNEQENAEQVQEQTTVQNESNNQSEAIDTTKLTTQQVIDWCLQNMQIDACAKQQENLHFNLYNQESDGSLIIDISPKSNPTLVTYSFRIDSHGMLYVKDSDDMWILRSTAYEVNSYTGN